MHVAASQGMRSAIHLATRKVGCTLVPRLQVPSRTIASKCIAAQVMEVDASSASPDLASEVEALRKQVSELEVIMSGIGVAMVTHGRVN
jgi:hypothetical protein